MQRPTTSSRASEHRTADSAWFERGAPARPQGLHHRPRVSRTCIPSVPLGALRCAPTDRRRHRTVRYCQNCVDHDHRPPETDARSRLAAARQRRLLNNEKPPFPRRASTQHLRLREEQSLNRRHEAADPAHRRPQSPRRPAQHSAPLVCVDAGERRTTPVRPTINRCVAITSSNHDAFRQQQALLAREQQRKRRRELSRGAATKSGRRRRTTAHMCPRDRAQQHKAAGAVHSPTGRMTASSTSAGTQPQRGFRKLSPCVANATKVSASRHRLTIVAGGCIVLRCQRDDCAR